jgi:hypothetical protein
VTHPPAAVQEVRVPVEPDVTDLVMRHHGQLRSLLEDVARAHQDRDLLVATCHALLDHEHAKRTVLYPLARRWLLEGEAVCDDLEERSRALSDGARRLAASTGVGRHEAAGGSGLVAAFADLARVEEHALIAPLRHRCPRHELVDAAGRYDELVGPPLAAAVDPAG